MSKKIKNNLPDDLNGSQDNLENVRKDLNSDNMKDEGLKDNIKIENAIAALHSPCISFPAYTIYSTMVARLMMTGCMGTSS